MKYNQSILKLFIFNLILSHNIYKLRHRTPISFVSLHLKKITLWDDDETIIQDTRT